MLINLPPFLEQKKIAQILSTWDKAISVTEKLLTNSQQQKKALMQQLLTGQKRLLDENGVRFSGEWVYLTFDNAFIVANKKSTQVKSSDYLQSGSIPIIDQGQSRIAGYCNNLEVYSDVPVIVFGDHTRCVKWIEFVFCPGADGTQVIKTSKILEPKLGYYLLSNTDIPNLGYSRHMRELKEKDFRLPLDIKEQQKIAAVLSAADAEISTLEKKLACLRDEKKALMQQLLTGKRRVKVDEAVAE
ncbi:restriction endonuclease subunit S [Escherichia coli]|nr:restriction endonuclease subunit S [Escherichia coli]